MRVGRAEKVGDGLLLAGIELARDDRPARAFDIGNERRELVGIAPAGKNREPFRGKFFRDRRADEIAGADDGRGGIAFRQFRSPYPLLRGDHRRAARRADSSAARGSCPMGSHRSGADDARNPWY